MQYYYDVHDNINVGIMQLTIGGGNLLANETGRKISKTTLSALEN